MSFLVAGTTIYFVYRYVLYDELILPFYDQVRESQRTILKKRFHISTRDAIRVLHQLSESEAYARFEQIRQRPIRAAAVHLLYQAGLCALPFVGFSLVTGCEIKAVAYLVVTALLLFSAWRIDEEYEYEEALFIKSNGSKVDAAAKTLGIKKAHLRA